MVTRCWNK